MSSATESAEQDPKEKSGTPLYLPRKEVACTTLGPCSPGTSGDGASGLSAAPPEPEGPLVVAASVSPSPGAPPRTDCAEGSALLNTASTEPSLPAPAPPAHILPFPVYNISPEFTLPDTLPIHPPPLHLSAHPYVPSPSLPPTSIPLAFAPQHNLLANLQHLQSLHVPSPELTLGEQIQQQLQQQKRYYLQQATLKQHLPQKPAKDIPIKSTAPPTSFPVSAMHYPLSPAPPVIPQQALFHPSLVQRSPYQQAIFIQTPSPSPVPSPPLGQSQVLQAPAQTQLPPPLQFPSQLQSPPHIQQTQQVKPEQPAQSPEGTLSEEPLSRETDYSQNLELLVDEIQNAEEDNLSSSDSEGNDLTVDAKLSRAQFREVIGVKFAEDLLSGRYSYDEIIATYQKRYPAHAAKFTRNFCSKVRCGRIMNCKTLKQRSVKNGDARMKRIEKVSTRKSWTRMTQELFQKILDWEKEQPGPIKQSEIERRWNVNRSTYHRWKKKGNL